MFREHAGWGDVLVILAGALLLFVLWRRLLHLQKPQGFRIYLLLGGLLLLYFALEPIDIFSGSFWSQEKDSFELNRYHLNEVARELSPR